MNIRIENGRVAKPFSVGWDPRDGVMDDPNNHKQRYLSKLTGMFYDRETAERGDEPTVIENPRYGQMYK